MKRVMCVTAGFYSKVIAEIPYVKCARNLQKWKQKDSRYEV